MIFDFRPFAKGLDLRTPRGRFDFEMAVVGRCAGFGFPKLRELARERGIRLRRMRNDLVGDIALYELGRLLQELVSETGAEQAC